jgi:uncharacterized protein YndB with AHSA1/START domain
MPFEFEGQWIFDVPPKALWKVLSRTERFCEWWPWLRSLESDGIVAGGVSHCVVRAPVPYRLRFDVTILEVEPERLIDTRVAGDLEGPARLELAEHPEGCEAQVSWTVELRDPVLRAASRLARPVMEWGHDWVVDTGLRQFRRAALDERAR